MSHIDRPPMPPRQEQNRPDVTPLLARDLVETRPLLGKPAAAACAHRAAAARWDACELCGVSVEACTDCKTVLRCCGCGNYHALDCPHP